MNGGAAAGQINPNELAEEEMERERAFGLATNQERLARNQALLGGGPLPAEAEAPPAAPRPAGPPAETSTPEEKEAELGRAQLWATRLRRSGIALQATGQAQISLGQIQIRSGQLIKMPAKGLIKFGAGLISGFYTALIGIPLVIMGAALWVLGHGLVATGAATRGLGRLQKQAGEKTAQAGKVAQETVAKGAEFTRETAGRLLRAIPSLPAVVNRLTFAKAFNREQAGPKRMFYRGLTVVAIVILGAVAFAAFVGIYCQSGFFPQLQCGITGLAT